jgi:hypothetical protein
MVGDTGNALSPNLPHHHHHAHYAGGTTVLSKKVEKLNADLFALPVKELLELLFGGEGAEVSDEERGACCCGVGAIDGSLLEGGGSGSWGVVGVHGGRSAAHRGAQARGRGRCHVPHHLGERAPVSHAGVHLEAAKLIRSHILQAL